MENPMQVALMQAVASRIAARENPELAAITDNVVNSWRIENSREIATALEQTEIRRLEALSPAGRTLTPEQEKKINETYDKIVALYDACSRPITRR